MMTVAELLSDLRKRDVSLWLEGDRLRLRAPKNAIGPDLHAALARHKHDIIQSLRAAAARPAATVPRLQPVPRSGRLPLSFGQQRFWFLQQMDPNSSVYHISDSLLIDNLDLAVLERALTEIVRRHEILRTTVQIVDGEPSQVIAPPHPVTVPLVDLRDLGEADARAEAARLKAETARTPFDLSRGPLFRCLALQHSAENFELLLTQHHIVTDGWSLALFYNELRVLYGAMMRGEQLHLPDVAIQYADYAHWQRRLLESDHLKPQLDYWRRQLQGLPVLEVPTDCARPATQTFTGALQLIALSKRQSDAVTQLARETGATLYMVLLAAFSVLLSKYSGQTDLAIGSSNGTRSRTELEHIIGFFVNTQVLRVDLSGNPTFREAIQRAMQVCLDAYANQDVPFERLVEVVSAKRDLSRSPLFDVMFILQNTQLETMNKGADAQRDRLRAAKAARLASGNSNAFATQFLSEGGGTRVVIETGISKFDLTLYLMETNEGIRGSMEYNTDLFAHPTVARMLDHLEAVFDAMTANPDARVSDVALLTAPEQKRFAEWQGPAHTLGADTVPALVAAQAARTPDAPAVSGTGITLTYAALDRRSNQVAQRLRAAGVTQGQRVGVCVDRTPDMVAALWGVWKAGAAYVPMDPLFPAERLDYMARDAAVTAILTDAASRGAVPASTAATVLALDDGQTWAGVSEAPLAPTAGGGDVAYVIYTSGSTGWPKGVAVPHRAVVNFLESMAQTPGFGASDVLVAVTTLSFDIAGLELWLPLTVGARVEVATREEASDGRLLQSRLAQSGATVLQATPATWRLLLDAGWRASAGLRMFCGGEGLPRELADRLVADGAELWNLYGPTETTIWSTAERVSHDGAAITIGRAIGNTQVYVLDRAGQRVPIGVLGELYIGGTGVAHGYHGRPELTADKFVPDAFSGVPGARLYRTGDVARWLPDGRLQCLGRIDHQVKVRGFRIELGEIEAALAAQPGIRQAVVTVHPDTSGEHRLVAYAVGDGTEPPVVSDLRAALKGRLPDYMVPSVFQFLDALPLTPNGKIDRKALPAPDGARPRLDANYIVPRTALEHSIAAVWQEVLGVTTVGVFDNFFDLGGHSLLLVKAHARLRDVSAKTLSILDLFRYPTIDALAKYISQAPASDHAALSDVRARAERTKQMAAARQRARQLVKH
jgi:amino acid adenylation domain-containing protein